jgi:hypothetical protein
MNIRARKGVVVATGGRRAGTLCSARCSIRG